MCRGLCLIFISIAALFIVIMYKNQNINNKKINNKEINNKETFYDSRGRGGHGYGGGGRSRHGYRGGRGGHGYGGRGNGFHSWWDPYYYSWGNWFPSSEYSVYSGNWRQCPQGSICPPYLSCNDPYCQ